MSKSELKRLCTQDPVGMAYKMDAQEQEIKRLNQKLALIIEVSKSVVARWDTPLWKDAPATAIFINELRAVSDGAVSTKLWISTHDQQVWDTALEDAASIFDTCQPLDAETIRAMKVRP